MARRWVTADGSALPQDDSPAPAQMPEGSAMRFAGEHGALAAASVAPAASVASAVRHDTGHTTHHATTHQDATHHATSHHATTHHATRHAADKAAADGAADEVTDGPAMRGRCWDERSRTWAAGAASVLLALVAGVSAVSWYGPGPAALGIRIVAVLAAAAELPPDGPDGVRWAPRCWSAAARSARSPPGRPPRPARCDWPPSD
ncbi:hypothetical protein O1L68_23290 [Streptomyces lydicus]|nr:hypothetical protein [Streptomyces lydicus]